MEKYKLKIKIGINEFEAEGPQSIVEAQFNAFKELVLNIPTAHEYAHQSSKLDRETPQDYTENSKPDPEPQLEKIMKVEERVVSLTTRARDVDEAILLILFGQKVLRDNSSVTGSEIMAGLKASGPCPKRVDRNLEKAGERGDVIVIGEKRSKRYRLTNQGYSNAKDICVEHISNVA